MDNFSRKKDFVSLSIFTFLTVLIVFIDSIWTLMKAIKTGIIRKEVLSEKSNLGFDLDIIIKS